jgi:hypothetical protein
MLKFGPFLLDSRATSGPLAPAQMDAANQVASVSTLMDILTMQTVVTPVASAPATMDAWMMCTVLTPVASVPAPTEDAHPKPLLAASLDVLRAISSSSATMSQPINESTAEYPNSDVCYLVEIEDGFLLRDFCGIGWAICI